MSRDERATWLRRQRKHILCPNHSWAIYPDYPSVVWDSWPLMEAFTLSPRQPHFDYDGGLLHSIQSGPVETIRGLTETALKAHDMSIPQWFRNPQSESTTAVAGGITPVPALSLGFDTPTAHVSTEGKPLPLLPENNKKRLGLNPPTQVPRQVHIPVAARRSPTPSDFSSSSEEGQPKSAMKAPGGHKRHLSVRWSADLIAEYPADDEGGSSDPRGINSIMKPLPQTALPVLSKLSPQPQNSEPSVQPVDPSYTIPIRSTPKLLFASTPSPPPVLQAPIPLPIDSFPVEFDVPTPYHDIPAILCAPRIKTSPLPEIRIPSPVVTRSKCPTLEELMQRNAPLDLTGKIKIPNSFKVAHGGFATVYTGVMYDQSVIQVAVKVLKAVKNPGRPAPWENALQRRLTREINVWSALSHPNIAEFLGYTDDFGDFTAMVSVWYRHGTATNYLSNEINSPNCGIAPKVFQTPSLESDWRLTSRDNGMI